MTEMDAGAAEPEGAPHEEPDGGGGAAAAPSGRANEAATEAAGEAASGPAPSLAGPVGARDILWKGLDLNLAASRDVRRAAILIGLLSLAAAGPLVAAFVAFADRVDRFAPGGFAVDLNAVEAIQGSRNILLLVLLIAVPCLVALSIDSQLLAVDVIARRATSRPFDLRSSLAIVRIRFWRLLRANVLIGLILLIPRAIIEGVVAPGGVVRESQLVTVTLLGIVLSIPFAYVATWIVLGQVGARESVRRSWRMARQRPSLAIVIAIINTLFQTVAIFALGAAAELLLRIVEALGLANTNGAGIIPLLVVVALGIAAAGSLVMTIAALTAGPQVVAFLRLTGNAGGLDALLDPDNPFATPHVEPLVTRPMLVALLVELAFGAILVVQML